MTFLNETTIEILVDYVVDYTKNVSEKKECEFRFGSFGPKEFVSCVEPEFFYRFQNILKRYSKPYYVNTTEEYYENQAGQIRKIIDKNTKKEYYMIKNSIRKYNVFDYDFRLALAKENYIKKPDNIENMNPKLIREKERTSFYFKTPVDGINLKYDFTLVTQDSKKLFEFEVELVMNKDFVYSEDSIPKLVEHLDDTFLTIVKTRQQNFLPISNNEKRLVLSMYKELTNTYYFIGAQPETLHKDQIQSLSDNYAVTAKVDGERQFLFVDKNNNCYLLDNNLKNIRKTNMKTKTYRNCLIDGELVLTDKILFFYAFDVLFFNGSDLRGIQEFNLQRRYKLVQDIERDFTFNGSSAMYIYKPKMYIFGNVFLGSKKLYESTEDENYKLDGLIFVPSSEPYPKTKKWAGLLKWKPSEMTTIDFWTEKDTTTNVWNLYVQKIVSDVKSSSNQTKKVLFDLEKLCGQHSEFVTFQTCFDDKMIDSVTKQSFLSETVIEFLFDKEHGRFVPIRTRWDKTMDTKKHGNYFTVACDIWKSIWNPISLAYLSNYHYNPSSNSKDKTQSPLYTNMRQYHNKVKQYLYNTYCNNIDSLAELCSGKGGDLHKWCHNRIRRVDGYDNHQPSINEAYKRLKQVSEQYSTNLNYNFYLMDLRNSELDLKQNFDYDVVSCQFGLHYFYESEKIIRNVLKTISSLLKNNGVFIGTILDNMSVDKLLTDNKYEHKIDNEVCFSLEKQVVTDFSAKLNVYLAGDNYLTNASHEYLIDFDSLVSLCKEYDLELVDSCTFGSLNNKKLGDMFNGLFTYEKIVSSLFRYFAFRKVKNPTTLELTINNSYEKSIRNLYNNQELSVVDLNWWMNDIKLVTIPTKQICCQMLNMKTVVYNPFKYSNDELDISEFYFDEFKRTNFIYVDNFEDQFMDKKITSYSKHFNNPVDPHYVILVKTKHMFSVTDQQTQEQSEIEKTVFGFLSFQNKFIFNSEEEALAILGSNTIDSTNTNTSVDSDKCDTVDELMDQKKTDYEKMTLSELKNLLKIQNQKISGKKSELIDRLLMLG